MIAPALIPRRTDSVLYACTSNIIRSPMAEAITRHLYGHRLYVQSVGLRPGEPDPFVISVMDEIGVDLSRHKSRSFDDLDDTFFDLVISLSPEAQHHAVEMTRTMACEVEFWNTFDPSLATGSRATVLAAYRQVRDTLMSRITARFDAGPQSSV